MSALLKVWVDAKKESAARVVAGRVQERLRGESELVSVAEYHKGGHKMHFHVPLDFKEWSRAVYELIARAQGLARLWTISGVIEEEAYLTSNDVPIPGVMSAHLILQKTEPNQPLQRNAGSRPSSDDLPTSETPSSLGPRG